MSLSNAQVRATVAVSDIGEDVSETQPRRSATSRTNFVRDDR